MKKPSLFFRRALAVVLTLITLCSVSLIGMPTASAVQVEGSKRTYDIAVVFDNSGSMFTSGNKAWCRAKYAMEIFASMLDFSKDKLAIFPMWEVTTDGTKPEFGEGGKLGPISISSPDDIDLITDMFTVSPDSTPLVAVDEAKNYLAKSTASEKWLVILTDGKFNREIRDEKDKPISTEAVENKFKSIPNSETNIKVVYLGFGNAPALSEDMDKGFYSVKSSDTSLTNDLVSICNTIFRRDEITKRLSDKTLTLDISMRKVIVFVQGPDAKVNSFTNNSTGKKYSPAFDSDQRKYSTVKANDNPNYSCSGAAVDNTLAGQVITFEKCEKGTYTLDYSGATKIQVFYEPDVDINVTLTDSEGKVVNFSNGQVVAGTYKVNFELVDAVTKKSVMDSNLLGKVNLKAKFEKSTDTKPTEVSNGGTINLQPDNKTEFVVEGTYGIQPNIYTISTKELGSIPNPIKVVEKEKPTEPPTEPPTTQPPAEFAAKIEPKPDWFKISDSENWEPIKVALTLNGKPLTADEFATVKLDEIIFEKELDYKLEPAPSESAYYIHICKDDEGNFVKPDTGVYKLQVKASMQHRERGKLTAEASHKFEIQLYDKIVRTIIITVTILFIIGLIIFILTRKAWPKKMCFIVDETNRRYSIKPGKKMSIVPMGGAISATAEKASQVRHMFGKKAKIRVTGINTRNNVVSYSINYVPYDNENPYKGVIRNSTAIEVNYDDGNTVSGKISIN